jgi:hypothetical protein
MNQDPEELPIGEDIIILHSDRVQSFRVLFVYMLREK